MERMGGKLVMENGTEVAMSGEQMRFLFLGYVLAVSLAHAGHDDLYAAAAEQLDHCHSLQGMPKGECGDLQVKMSDVTPLVLSEDEIRKLMGRPSAFVDMQIITLDPSDPAATEKALRQIFGL